MKRTSWCVVIGGLILSGAVAASTLDDFKEAAKKEDCQSIPYADIRGVCIDKGREVDDWCKNSSRPIKCDDVDPPGIRRKIDNVKGKIAELKRERDELSSKVSNAKDDSERRDFEDKKKAKETMIYDLERKVDGWETDFSNEKRTVSDRIYNGERCVGLRMEVAKEFSKAKSKAQSESDPELRPYRDHLISYWEKKTPGHEEAIRNYTQAVEKCKQLQ